MKPVAWLVLGEPHVRALCLDHGRAVMQAAACHGIVKALVLEEQVAELVRAAFEEGRARGNSRKR